MYTVLILRKRDTLPIFKAPLSTWYYWIITQNLASFSAVLSLESLFECPNLGLTIIKLGMSLGNPLGSMIDSIWDINWCGPWIGTWKFFWQFNWVPSFLLSLLGIWHTNWHADGNFTWKLYEQVSWGLYMIAFVLLFDSPLESLFEYDSLSNFLQLIVDI